MNRTTLALILTTGLTLGLGACGGTEEDTSEFRAAIPTSKDLTMTPPGTAGGSALIGQPAIYALLSAGAALDVNTRVGWTATVLGSVTLLPPSSVQPDKANWGPYVDASNGIGWELEVRRTAPKEYAWSLFATTAAGARVETSRGTSRLNTTSFADYTGTFTVLLDTYNQHDPNKYPSTGRIDGVYAQTADTRYLALDFADYVKEPGMAKNNWTYDYLDRPNGSGVFKYDSRQDLQNDGSAEELYKITTQWDAQAAGRADVSVSGGDTTTPIDQIECWDGTFKRTYWKNPTGLVVEEGAAQSCVF